MNVNNISIQVDDAEYGTEYATFNSWIYGIMRSGFGTPSMAELNAYTEQLKVVYEKITYEKGGSRYFSSKYNKKLVEANIRKAFCDKTDFNTTEELIPEEANLLNIANFTSEIYADNLDDYYPRQNVVENIMADDMASSGTNDSYLGEMIHAVAIPKRFYRFQFLQRDQLTAVSFYQLSIFPDRQPLCFQQQIFL